MKFTKINLPTPNRLMIDLMFLIVGIALGVGITTVPVLAKFTLPKLAFLANKISPQLPQKVITVDVLAEKKQKLEKFYSEISTASDKKDWSKLYELVPQSVRDNVDRSEFIAYYNSRSEKNKTVSEQTIINSIQVNGDSGIVYRTRIICINKECSGDNRKEESAKREYVYIDEKWQIPDSEPSERALKAANYGFQNSSKSDQKDLISQYGYGSESSTFAVRNWAVYLDGNLEELIRVETIVEQDKLDRSRPIYNQQPAQIIQQPAPIINQPAPIIQQQTSPKHCTSNTIGDYTYTNCY